MTRTQRAAELARLAWLADGGHLPVASGNPDAEAIIAAIEQDVADFAYGEPILRPWAERVRYACDLFASAAMSLAVHLGGEP